MSDDTEVRFLLLELDIDGKPAPYEAPALPPTPAHVDDRLVPAIDLPPGHECAHYDSFEISMTRPDVRCKTCGGSIDPYSVIRKIARKEISFCWQVNANREELGKLKKEVEELKRKRSYLRSAVKKDEDPGSRARARGR